MSRIQLLALTAALAGIGYTGAAQRPTQPPKLNIVERFDGDANGRLDDAERAEARTWLADNRRGRRGGRFGSRGRGAADPAENSAPPIEPDKVKHFPKRPLYDPMVLRTVFLYLPQNDWYQELATFYGTDVNVPGRLVVDGKTYAGVGVRFRGSSSYSMTGRSRKKPFNIALDHTDPKQRLLGFKTLNLLNGNSDNSFVREALFAHVAGEYVEAMPVNFVKLVVNGESWGVYLNAMQFNKDYLDHAFGSRKGVRWKVRRNFGGVGALSYLGDSASDYDAYDLKTTGDEEAWARLTRFFKLLEQTPVAEAEKVLPAVLDVDGALWFLALENVFMDADGYVRQGYDYRLCEDKNGRFHPVLYDNNEVLPAVDEDERSERMRARLGQQVLTTTTTPLINEDNPERPLIAKLLAVPAWRARYLAHVRTLATEWLDWSKIGAVAKRYHDLVDSAVAQDDKKLIRYEAFLRSLEGEYDDGRRLLRSLRTVVGQRREFLLGHALLRGPWPDLTGVTHEVEATQAGRRVLVRARVGGGAKVDRVLLWYATKRDVPYTAVPMHDDGKHDDGAAGDGVFGGAAPAMPARAKLRFYVEARADATTGKTAFYPSKAESGPLLVR